ncbi:hypothetical protein [Saccharothrix obliqua]|nr:hypothetical protein [Saccharothrix obliqua]MBW4718140.1 hypothetical protein [Saccharothrix obliqua]
MIKKSLPARYESPVAAEVGRFTTETKGSKPRGKRDGTTPFRKIKTW